MLKCNTLRCLVAGPSQPSKSTFVCNLLLQQNDIIDICFAYVMIVLGIKANKNEILSSLKDELMTGVMEIIKLKKLYETTELMKENFSSEFENFVKKKGNRKKRDVLFLITSCQSSQNVAFCLIYLASTHLIMNGHQMYGWKKATALGERFVAKNILEVRDSTKIFKLLKALASRNVPQSMEDLIYWMFVFLCEKWNFVPKF